MSDQEYSTPVSGDLVHGDKPVLSGTFTGTVNVNPTIIQQAAPTAGSVALRPRIFLSYAWADDKPFVERLHADLEARGFDVWRDETDMGSDGPDLPDTLRSEIERRERFVPVIGPAAFERPVVQAEWNHARLCCKPFTPVWRLGERPPTDAFADLLYVDFRDAAAYTAKLDDLARLLRRMPDSPGPFLTRVPDLPPGVISRKELGQLRRLRHPLAAGQTIAITGRTATHAVHAAGGLGKSVLAALFARECDTRWAFDDGVVWLEVGKTPSIAALQAELGRLFGDDPREYVDARVGASRLQRLLAERHVLIVLDDVWDYHHVEAFMVDAPRCRWLVTTRLGGLADDLGLAEEQCVALDYLSEEEALQLIASRMNENDPKRAAQDWDINREIVRELHGHTQAVAIAAARLAAKSRKGLAAAELLRRYRDPRPGENPLSVLKLEDENKELNLEKSLGESYTMLDETGRRRFRQLGVFAPEGTFGVAAVVEVWEEDEATADEALRELVDLALLSTDGEGRYSQHTLLRAYALALLREEGGEVEARARHFGYYAAQYGESSRNFPKVYYEHLQQFEVDFANVSQAITWGFVVIPVVACNLATAMDNSYMQFSQPYPVRHILLGAALDAARKVVYLQGEAEALLGLGELNVLEANYEIGRQYYNEALSLFASLADKQGEANTQLALGELDVREDNNTSARRRFDRALELYRVEGNKLGQANTLSVLGDIDSAGSDFSAARKSYLEAQQLYQSKSEKLGQANILLALGQIDMHEDSYEAARERYESALAFFRDARDNLGEAHVLRALGELYTLQGQGVLARVYCESAIALYGRIPNRRGAANALMNLGDLDMEEGQYKSAQKHYETALPLFKAVRDRLGEAQVRWRLGELAHAQVDLRAAGDQFTTVAELLRVLGLAQDEAAVKARIARVWQEQGRIVESTTLFIEVLTYFHISGLDSDAQEIMDSFISIYGLDHLRQVAPWTLRVAQRG